MELALLGALTVTVGGVGVFMLRQMAELGRKSAQDTSGPPRDKLAELERLIGTYRTEVLEFQDRVERWFQRVNKRAARDAEISPDPSTGNPQDMVGSKAELRRKLFALRTGVR